jgi:hypothetical protein
MIRLERRKNMIPKPHYLWILANEIPSLYNQPYPSSNVNPLWPHSDQIIELKSKFIKIHIDRKLARIAQSAKWLEKLLITNACHQCVSMKENHSVTIIDTLKTYI